MHYLPLLDNRAYSRYIAVSPSHESPVALKKLLLLFAGSCIAWTAVAQHPENVFIIVVDGARYSETFGDSTHQYIPQLWNQLRPLGTIYTKFFVDGVTKTNPAHASILSGTWQTIANDGTERPHMPTLFEYFRKSSASPIGDTYVVLGKDKLDILSYSDHPEYGSAYSASVKMSVSQYDDARTLENFREVARASHPRLAIMNMAATDISAHTGVWSSYVSSLRRVDSLLYELWTFIQSDSVYRDNTTLFVTNDHGRHLDGVSDGFKGHGDSCEGCRHTSLLVIGPGTPAGAVDSLQWKQIDIAPTVGSLLGFETPHADGRVIATVLPTGVRSIGTRLPAAWSLSQNYPNPFNPTTVITYFVPVESRVRIRVYTLLGQEAGTPVDGVEPAGERSVAWTIGNGATGVYVYRMEATALADPTRSFSQIRRMIMAK